MSGPLYKVCTEAAFAEAMSKGRFEGSPDDRRDGFIHLSAADQLRGTLDKHFARQPGLVLLEVDANRLGDDLKWETSRGGALFPHLYATLDFAAVLSVVKLELAENGSHLLPVEVSA
jgi:uncharacterized protein (DUF952 family)